MYQIFYGISKDGESYMIAELSDIDQAFAFAFQLHTMSNTMHAISLYDDSGEKLALLVRSKYVSIPKPAKK